MTNFLAITYALMLSYCPCENFGGNNFLEQYKNITQVQYEIGIDVFNCVSFYTGEGTSQSTIKDSSCWFPYLQNYYLGMEVHKKVNDAFNVKVGISHICQHPLNCWKEQRSHFNYSCTKMYISCSGKINIL